MIVGGRWSIYKPRQLFLDEFRKFLHNQTVVLKKTVVVLGEVVPLPRAACPKRLYAGFEAKEKTLFDQCVRNSTLLEWQLQPYNMNARMQDIIHEFSNVWYWNADEASCPNGWCNLYNRHGVRRYWDATHRWYGGSRIDGMDIIATAGVPYAIARALSGPLGPPSES